MTEKEKKYNESLKKLLKKHKNSKKRLAFENCWTRLNNANEVLQSVLDSTKDSRIRNEARKNFVVNLVTALEVFCKELIIERKGKWNDNGLSDLLSNRDKITFNQAFDLYQTKQFSKEHLVLFENSFQSIESIENVFSKLTGSRSFLNDLIEVQLTDIGELKTIKDAIPGWRIVFSDLFQLRHLIIHEGNDTPLEKKQIKDAEIVTRYFLIAIGFMFKYLND